MPLPVLPYFHAAATVCPWLGSSIYHLFMNHYSGYPTYERLLQWDVAGVWVTQSCGKWKYHKLYQIVGGRTKYLGVMMSNMDKFSNQLLLFE